MTGAPVTPQQVHWIIPVGTGDVGRNTYINPGQINFNMGITRNFPIPHHEGHQLRFRAELYNPCNHPNETGGVNTNLTSDDVNNPAHLFDPYWAREGGRTMKFQLKYAF